MTEVLPESTPDLASRRKRLVFRAEHRGTKEADMILGGFVRRHVDDWDHAHIAWFETLLEEPDRDILAWIMRAEPAPEPFDTPLMRAMQALDYVTPDG